MVLMIYPPSQHVLEPGNLLVRIRRFLVELDSEAPAAE